MGPKESSGVTCVLLEDPPFTVFNDFFNNLECCVGSFKFVLHCFIILFRLFLPECLVIIYVLKCLCVLAF